MLRVTKPQMEASKCVECSQWAGRMLTIPTGGRDPRQRSELELEEWRKLRSLRYSWPDAPSQKLSI